MLSPEQVQEAKKQLIEQIKSILPPDKIEQATREIEGMSDKQLEDFLVKNNLIKNPDSSSEGMNCIFCSIVFGDVESYKIRENEKAVAVLEINPISKGHTLVIPKEHIADVENIPDKAKTLAKEVAEKIKQQLVPKDIILYTASMFGHAVINVLPVYSNENPQSPRKQASKDELEGLKELLGNQEANAEGKEKDDKSQEETQKTEIEQINAEDIWMPKRIP